MPQPDHNGAALDVAAWHIDDYFERGCGDYDDNGRVIKYHHDDIAAACRKYLDAYDRKHNPNLTRFIEHYHTIGQRTCDKPGCTLPLYGQPWFSDPAADPA